MNSLPSRALLRKPVMASNRTLITDRIIPATEPIYSVAPGDFVKLRFSSLRRHVLLLVSCFLLALLLGGTIYASIGDKYSASVRLIIGHREPQFVRDNAVFSATTARSALIDTQVELIRSQLLLNRAVKSLGVDGLPTRKQSLTPFENYINEIKDFVKTRILQRTPPPEWSEEQKKAAAIQDLSNVLTVRRIGESHIIEITATTKEPAKSALIANITGHVYIEYIKKVNEATANTASPWLQERLRNFGTSADIVTQAVQPTHPDGPNLKQIVIFFSAVGLALGVLIAFAIDSWSPRIETEDDLPKFDDAEFFGTVQCTDTGIQRKRRSAGSRTGLSKQAAITVTRAVVACFMERPHLTSIGLVSCTKDEGAANVAKELAIAASENGLRTLFVDCNVQDTADETAPISASWPEGTLVRSLKCIRRDAACDHLKKGYVFALRTRNTAIDILNWKTISRRIARISSNFDIVIAALPPLLNSSAARASAETFDGFILVVKGDKLYQSQSRKILRNSGPIQKMVVGVILNKP